jgi:hypothetical protein
MLTECNANGMMIMNMQVGNRKALYFFFVYMEKEASLAFYVSVERPDQTNPSWAGGRCRT